MVSIVGVDCGDDGGVAIVNWKPSEKLSKGNYHRVPCFLGEARVVKLSNNQGTNRPLWGAKMCAQSEKTVKKQI